MFERLERSTVSRVRQIIREEENAGTLHNFLRKLPLADHRAAAVAGREPINIYSNPGRVRLLDVPTPQGQRKVIVKFVHGGTFNTDANTFSKKTGEERPAHLTVAFIHHLVALNQQGRDVTGAPIGKNRAYRLKRPVGYPIHDEVVVMARSRLPEVTEMVPTRHPDKATERGRKRLAELQRMGVTEEDLFRAAKQAQQHTGIDLTNLAVHGYRGACLPSFPESTFSDKPINGESA